MVTGLIMAAEGSIQNVGKLRSQYINMLQRSKDSAIKTMSHQG